MPHDLVVTDCGPVVRAGIELRLPTVKERARRAVV